MLFAVIFTDVPGKGAVRERELAAHLEWLELNKAVISIGGSLRREVGDVPEGGLWIAEARSRAEVESLVKFDPFYIAGLRQSFDVFHWSKANTSRKVLL